MTVGTGKGRNTAISLKLVTIIALVLLSCSRALDTANRAIDEGSPCVSNNAPGFIEVDCQQRVLVITVDNITYD